MCHLCEALLLDQLRGICRWSETQPGAVQYVKKQWQPKLSKFAASLTSVACQRPCILKAPEYAGKWVVSVCTFTCFAAQRTTGVCEGFNSSAKSVLDRVTGRKHLFRVDQLILHLFSTIMPNYYNSRALLAAGAHEVPCATTGQPAANAVCHCPCVCRLGSQS